MKHFAIIAAALVATSAHAEKCEPGETCVEVEAIGQAVATLTIGVGGKLCGPAEFDIGGQKVMSVPAGQCVPEHPRFDVTPEPQE